MNSFDRIPASTRYIFFTLMSIFLSVGCVGQDAPDPVPGVPLFGTFSGPPDNINLQNLNIHLDIPLFQKRGRMFDTRYTMTYDSSHGPWNDFVSGWGRFPTSPAGSVTAVAHDLGECVNQNGDTVVYGVNGPFTYTDGHGQAHVISLYTYAANNCVPQVGNGGTPSTASAYADDNSGVYLTATGDRTVSVLEASGARGSTITGYSIGPCPFTMQTQLTSDANGNQMSDTYATAQCGSSQTETDTFTDSSGTQFRVASATNNPLVTTVSYTDSNGVAQTTTINSKQYLVGLDAGYSPYLPNCTNYYAPLPSSIVYADGSSYQFTYEPTPGYPGCTTSRLASLTLPSGGTISYVYTSEDATPRHYLQVTGMTRTAPDRGITQYSVTDQVDTVVSNCPSACWNNSATIVGPAPDYNTTVVTFAGIYETSRKVYQGAASGTPLSTTTICYNSHSNVCAAPRPALFEGVTEIDKTTTLSNGLSSRVDTRFHVLDYPAEVDEYDYGATTPTRRTVTTYAPLGNNILIKPSDITIYDGNVSVAETTYAYDETAVAASDSVAAPAVVSGSRGNVTTITRLNPGGVATQTTMAYYDTGMLYTVKNTSTGVGSHTGLTTYLYDASGAFPLSINITNADGSNISSTLHKTLYNYDDATGLLANTTDWNNQKTTYSYDSVGRPVQETFPLVSGGLKGGVQYCYNYLIATGQTTVPVGCANSVANSVQTTKTNSPNNMVTNAAYDSTGRIAHLVQSDGNTVDTTYDLNGHIQSQSNPHGSSPGPTDGFTSFSYDALGRKLLQCQPDNGTGAGACAVGSSYLQWSYDGAASSAAMGNLTITRDEDGDRTQQFTDGLDRIRQIVEPGGLTTTYAYNVVGNLRVIGQLGNAANGDSPRNRNFTYDALSRIISSINPETGIVCYGTTGGRVPTAQNCTSGYDGNGNLHAKTDARGVTTNYSYDALNRLVAKTYTNDASGALASCYQYDTLSTGGANLVGRLTAEWTQKLASGASCPSTKPSGTMTSRTLSAYDAMGRITSETQCVGNSCTKDYASSPTYTYDLAGNLTLYGNLIGTAQFSNGYDGAGRLSSVTDAWTGAAQVAPLYPASLFSSPVYTPFGALSAATYGTGLTLSRTYDSRLRVTGEIDTGSLGGNPAAPGKAVISISGAVQAK